MSFPITLRLAFNTGSSDESILCCPFCGSDSVQIKGFRASSTRESLVSFDVACSNCPDLESRKLWVRNVHGRTALCWVVE